MKNFLASRPEMEGEAGEEDQGMREGSFKYQEEEKIDDMEQVYAVIEEQPETNYDDMISNNLVQFEYDVFQQIRAQLHKKTNSLFLICKHLARAFVNTYGQYTALDATCTMDKQQMKRKTRQLKSTIQEVSMNMRSSNNLPLSQMMHSSSDMMDTSADRSVSNFMGDHSIDQLNSSDQSRLDLSASSDQQFAFDKAGQEQPMHTLSTKAVDELYELTMSFCHLIEIFFQPFYPSEVTHDLHQDLMLLS